MRFRVRVEKKIEPEPQRADVCSDLLAVYHKHLSWDLLLRRNHGYITRWVTSFAWKFRAAQWDYEDVYQEMLVAIMGAIEKYNPLRNDNILAWVRMVVDRTMAQKARFWRKRTLGEQRFSDFELVVENVVPAFDAQSSEQKPAPRVSIQESEVEDALAGRQRLNIVLGGMPTSGARYVAAVVSGVDSDDAGRLAFPNNKRPRKSGLRAVEKAHGLLAQVERDELIDIEPQDDSHAANDRYDHGEEINTQVRSGLRPIRKTVDPGEREQRSFVG
jgi:DNA-directed RNA polymerase specialized sigma24 family protein